MYKITCLECGKNKETKQPKTSFCCRGCKGKYWRKNHYQYDREKLYQWREKNPLKIKTICKKYYASLSEEEKEKRREYSRKSYQKHIHKNREKNRIKLQKLKSAAFTSSRF